MNVNDLLYVIYTPSDNSYAKKIVKHNLLSNCLVN